MSKVMVLDMKNEAGPSPVSRMPGQKPVTHLKTFPPAILQTLRLRIRIDGADDFCEGTGAGIQQFRQYGRNRDDLFEVIEQKQCLFDPQEIFEAVQQ